MLKDEDRIFKNLYNDLGADIVSAQKRDDWKNTKEICEKGREWIINEIKNVANTTRSSNISKSSTNPSSSISS